MASKNKGSQNEELLLKSGSLHWISYTSKVIRFAFGELGAISFSILTKGYVCGTYEVMKYRNIGYNHSQNGNNGRVDDIFNMIGTDRCERSVIRIERIVVRWKLKDEADRMVNMSNAKDKYILENVVESVGRRIQPIGKFVSVSATKNKKENGQQMIELVRRESKIDEYMASNKEDVIGWNVPKVVIRCM